jgi:hypothetical protein
MTPIVTRAIVPTVDAPVQDAVSASATRSTALVAALHEPRVGVASALPASQEGLQCVVRAHLDRIDDVAAGRALADPGRLC